ncbi:MAG TPA: alpha/beta hydrolase [Candidatus Avalokitesvara rifleensis]|uniref:alpha/beta hydrolase n=1 Tax=Candidatus Avalokitesvara rifleensis TaxID=3367620 RepID=UPI0027126B6F|nr:hypothetical protein [Candidatus Brocadiales bacterium]
MNFKLCDSPFARPASGLLLFILCLASASCSSVEKRISRADKIADKACLTKEAFQGDYFRLIVFQRIKDKNLPLRVYIEGDGKAFLRRTRISSNPTPENPLALRLASLDKYPNILYIARPFQYHVTADIPEGADAYWTTYRFSPEVVRDVNNAINKIKGSYGIESIVLIGYSGGGAIAELVAAGRKDVLLIITVAGNLDIDYHVKFHKLNPLTESPNPADYGDRLRLIPQIHFVGMNDKIVPSEVAESFKGKIKPEPGNFKVIKLRGYTHHDGWAENWSKLLSQYLNDSGLLDN